MELRSREDIARAAERLLSAGLTNVYIKGGHPLPGEETAPAADFLFCKDGSSGEFTSERFATPHTHGTGCTFSAAVTACLARGLGVRDAVAAAKRFIAEAIRTAPGLGHGQGPVNHFTPVVFETSH
jgi:hydroxymethylpyrimidine/phosphomethylpyrimidine kinase